MPMRHPAAILPRISGPSETNIETARKPAAAPRAAVLPHIMIAMKIRMVELMGLETGIFVIKIMPLQV